jgi:glyoxylase-like metal-dependent hydrolase (beta-lactamase superfamily II)
MNSDLNLCHPTETALSAAKPSKPPRLLLANLFAFTPNRDTLGGTAYFIVENTGNILLDCPAWDGANQEFLLKQGVRRLYLTHRGAMGKQVKQMQLALGCEVIIQEQEAYLLPNVAVTTFREKIVLNDNCYGFWTPGHSPGSSCLYWSQHGGVIFSGRHLLPNAEGKPVPLRLAKTFHFGRQLKSVNNICDRFTSQTLYYLCPGANTGFLRGKGIIENVYPLLSEIV